MPYIDKWGNTATKEWINIQFLHELFPNLETMYFSNITDIKSAIYIIHYHLKTYVTKLRKITIKSTINEDANWIQELNQTMFSDIHFKLTQPNKQTIIIIKSYTN